jgi:hypothetical protein
MQALTKQSFSNQNHTFESGRLFSKLPAPLIMWKSFAEILILRKIP